MDDTQLREHEEELLKQKATRNYFFYHPVGQIIEHVDTVNFSMDKDGTFHFQNVGQVNGEPSKNEVVEEEAPVDEELCKFIHPAMDEAEARKIHLIVKRLVHSHGIQEICQYLNQLSNEGKILLPMNPSSAYKELTRLGMPNSEGYNIKTFQKYYRK